MIVKETAEMIYFLLEHITYVCSSVDYTQAGSVTVVAWQDQSLLGVQEMHPSQANEVMYNSCTSLHACSTVVLKNILYLERFMFKDDIIYKKRTESKFYVWKIPLQSLSKRTHFWRS